MIEEFFGAICPNCNGSGEGMYDGAICPNCYGSGEVSESEGEGHDDFLDYIDPNYYCAISE